MEIRLTENGDLSGWVQLVEPMRHLFPGLEPPESMEGYARDIAGAISRQEALCAVENGTICGVLAFSREENELGFCPGRLVEVDGSPAQEFLRPAEIPGSERSEAE